MPLIITNQTGSLFVIWLVLALAGSQSFQGFYKSIRNYDKFIHFFSGIVIALFLLDNNFSIFAILSINLISGIAWESFQEISSKQVLWDIFGFEEGRGDIIIHMVGTIATLLLI